MPNPFISAKQKNTTTIGPAQTGYQQALHDFAIIDLIQHLTTYTDSNFNAAQAALTTQEAESLAVILIQTLTANLTGQLIASILNTLRHRQLDTSSHLTSLSLPPPSIPLPATFPDVETPRFLYGDRLNWISDNEATDWGIVIGRFYSFAPHHCRWAWCYLIWLDPDSPSTRWTLADTAWEDDLEPLEEATS